MFCLRGGFSKPNILTTNLVRFRPDARFRPEDARFRPEEARVRPEEAGFRPEEARFRLEEAITTL